MRNSDLSAVYDYAREVLEDTPQGVYQVKKDELKKKMAAEQKEYKSAIGKQRKKVSIVIPLVLCICIVLVAVYFIKGQDYNDTESIVSDIVDTSSSVYTEASITEIETDTTVVETATTVVAVEDTTVTETSVQTEVITEITEEMTEAIVETTQTPVTELDEKSVESYNGFKLGDIVHYSGTVHYVSCDSSELAGPCVGGKAMISVIRPDAMHTFHLVAADDSCTVYGWVDECFVSQIDDSE